MLSALLQSTYSKVFRRVAVAIIGTGVVYGAGTIDIVPQTAEVPATAVIKYAAKETVFDTPTGHIEDGYYYALEDGSGYIAHDSKVFTIATNYEEFSKAPYPQYQLATILGYQDRVHYTDGGVNRVVDMYPSRYDSLAVTNAKMDILKQDYSISLNEVIFSPLVANAAIAFDAKAIGGPTTATSITFSHTQTGSNLALAVSAYTLNDTITGITYNSVAMSFVNKTTYPGAGRIGATEYHLEGGSTGANNVVVSASGSVQIIGMSSSYTGVKQTAQPNPTGNNTGTSVSGTCTMTAATANSWYVMAEANAAGTCTAGASTNLRQTDANGACHADGGPFTGSNTLTVTHGSALFATVCMAFEEAAAAGGTDPQDLTWFLMLMQ